MRRSVAILIACILLILAGLAVRFGPAVRSYHRSVTASHLYDCAVAYYMIRKVDECETTFAEIANLYGDLPIGAMAELKIAWLAYDQHRDLDRAEALFSAFLQNHPQGVLYLSDTPLPDYDGELETVAWYFLGRIARDRGNAEAARSWFERVDKAGSRNPANIVVGDTRAILRRMTEDEPNGDHKDG